jgi:hypothetical protein
MAGALAKAAGLPRVNNALVDVPLVIQRPLRQYLQRVHGDGAIAFFNDAPERTQEEVVTALRKAAELARSSTGRLDTNESQSNV